MSLLLLFLEGVITFISPCLLPMLPIYVSYFAGGRGKARALKNAVAFVLGFTAVFVTMGAFAGQTGFILRSYSTALNVASGGIVVLFGLSFLGVFNLPFLNMQKRLSVDTSNMGVFKSFVFGVVFSVSWTPCVGAFLGSALMIASQEGSALKGVLMLLSYSAGLGVPFIASAIFINRLKSTFDFIKRNYKIINAASGVILIITGVFMMTGRFGYFLRLLSV